jgi:DNA invertase Pin-like site-specific DNA recombinase
MKKKTSPLPVRQPTVKVALYGRCSTNETKQDVENQFIQLREACNSKGWQIVREYVDYESGRKGRDKRLDFDRMLIDASQGVFQLLYFWRLDRFSREGIKMTIHYLELLNGWNIRFKSHTETYLDTDNELISHILLGVLSYFAEQEAVKISENTKIGLIKARKKGKRLGRPPSRKWRRTKSLRPTEI